MPGIIISQIENIDEEPDYDKLAAERARRLREKRLGVNKEAIELKKKEDAEKQQAEINRSRTSVNVTNTSNGTVTTTTTTSPNGTTSTETVTTTNSDDPFTDEVETAEDTPVNPPKEEENINEQEATETQNQIEQFDKPHIDSNVETNLIKQGIDTSDVENGKENQREAIPENPKTNPNDPVLNNGNNGNTETQTQHCTNDTKPEEKPEEKQETSNVIIGENPNEKGEEIAIPSESATCPSPNTNSLNDFQKEVLWVALDMLKWQPITDTYGKEGKKRYWDYLDITDGRETQRSFYKNYTYPDDPTFGRFKHKGILPLDRLFTFYNGFASEKPKLDKAPAWAWCAVTTSVMYMFAMLQMEVTHKDTKSQENNGTTIWSPKLNKKIQVPFRKHNNSGHIVGSNSRNFGYNLSWEPTPGAIMFKLNNGGAGSDCGHSGLVMDVTKEKSIITIEGNGGQDCSIRVWPRDTYYQDAWRISHREGWVEEKMGWKSIHAIDDVTEKEFKKGRQLDHGICGYHDNKDKDAKWWNVKIPFPYPTDSKWHWLFLNPSISNDAFSEIKGKPSREGNPLPELYSLLDGFYNREGSGGKLNSSAVT